MPKQSGLGMRMYIDGYRVSGDVASIDRIAGPQAVQDVTDIEKSAVARLGLVRDGAIELTAFFNPDGTSNPKGIHTVLSTLPLTDRISLVSIGTAAGSPAAALVHKQLNYDASREQSGALSFKSTEAANGYGLEWGTLATAAERTDTVATNGAGVNLGTNPTATVAFGLQAYLQVLSFTGTSAAIKLQGSSDDGAGDAYADITGGAFASVTTAPQAQRIATANNLSVEQYVRVVTSGTFSSLVFVVMVNRNTVLSAF
jgi:hypothetical protein